MQILKMPVNTVLTVLQLWLSPTTKQAPIATQISHLWKQLYCVVFRPSPGFPRWLEICWCCCQFTKHLVFEQCTIYSLLQWQLPIFSWDSWWVRCISPLQFSECGLQTMFSIKWKTFCGFKLWWRRRSASAHSQWIVTTLWRQRSIIVVSSQLQGVKLQLSSSGFFPLFWRPSASSWKPQIKQRRFSLQLK